MTGSQREILVVDDEIFFTTIVGKMLQGKGYAVRTASNAAEGLGLALVQPPDLIVSDIMMPAIDGWTFLKQVRSQPSLALVPFLFLTAIPEPENARIRGFRLGADDFVEKAHLADELAVRVEAIFFKQEQLLSEHEAQIDFGGSLAALGVATVLQMVAQEGKTGVVTFSGPDGTAEVSVVNGHPMAAALPGLSLEGEEVVYTVLGWDAGSFRFVAGPPVSGRNIDTSMQGLLLEGARRIDESAVAYA